MLVKDVMKKDVITLPPTASIQEALHVLQKHRIRHIPIVDKDDHVLGIVSDRDVRDASPSIFDNNPKEIDLHKQLKSIMSYPVVTVHPLDFIEEIARIFYDEEISSVPVVKNNQLVGIINEKDMLYTLIQLTGTHVQGSYIQVKAKDRPGTLPEITSFFGKRNINIISLLIYPCVKDPDYKTLVIRFQTMNPTPIVSDLREAGFHLIWPYQIQEPLL